MGFIVTFWYTYIMYFLLKNMVLLDNIILSNISQAQKAKNRMFSLIYGL
jgi:hypothetical protein